MGDRRRIVKKLKPGDRLVITAKRRVRISVQTDRVEYRVEQAKRN